MAHNYSSILSSQTPEYHPLGHLQSPYYSPDTARSGALYDSRDFRFDATSYSGHDITDYRNDHSAPSLTASEPKSRYLPDSSTQKLYPTEVITNPLTEKHLFDFRDWQWEFGASVFSLRCFAAVIGVLAANEQKSLAGWTFVFGISLNTLIAILSTLSRTALMVPVASCISQLKWIHLASTSRPLRDVQVFDDASRGPWGSLELIWRLHIKSTLATWGALITILTLAMGPFAQHHIYDSAYGEPRQLRAASGRITSTMGPKMQGAILNGLYNLTTAVQFFCSTGDCQWAEFFSFAVASTCTNVTSDTETLCGRSGSWFGCNYTTPAGFFVTSSHSARSGGGTSTSFNTTAFKPASYDYGPIDDRSSPVNSTIARIALVNLDGEFNMTRPDVSECNMRLIARVTRNLTVTNGTFNPGSFEDIELEGFPADTMMRNKVVPVSGIGTPSTLRETIRHTLAIDRSTTTQLTSRAPKNLLYNIFTADSGSASAGSQVSPYYWPLMNSTDRAGTVASIAQSMSYAFAHAPSGEVLKGIALSSELYIKVHWLWIILPLTEVTMSVAFLVCTLIHTQRKGVTVWKSSGIMPLLTVMVGGTVLSLGLRPGEKLRRDRRTCGVSLWRMLGMCKGFIEWSSERLVAKS